MSITNSLAKIFANYNDQSSLGSRFRKKRIGPLLHLIDKLAEKYDKVNIIDIGGTEHYWGIIPLHELENKNVRITIVNLPSRELPEDHGPFRFTHGDACHLSQFEDNTFHIAHSNSVVEHVGDWNHMVQYSKEIKRIAKFYFVQTPNYWFPIEPHCMTPFFHWLPKPLRIKLVMNFSLGHWKKATSVDEAVRTVDGAQILNKPMFAALFKESRIVTEKFLFLSKSFIAIRD